MSDCSAESNDKLIAMKESAANRKLQVEGNNEDEISVLICPDFDIDNPYSYAMDKLKAEQSRANRPSSPRQMSLKQLEEDKKDLKRILRDYDLAFQHRYGNFVSERGVLFVFIYFY